MQPGTFRHLSSYLLFVILGAVPSLSSQSQSTSACSKSGSKVARSIIKSYVDEHAKWIGYTLPEACPLHSRRDIFAAHERAKHHDSISHWRCGFCGKVHRSESYLDVHLASVHPNEVQPGSDVCLADLCDLLHCNQLTIMSEVEEQPAADAYSRNAPCLPAEQAALRKKCIEIAEACFPVEGGPKSPLMWDFFAGHFCAAHTCDETHQDNLLNAIRKSRPGIRWGYTIFAGFATTIILGFYIVFWAYMRFYVGMIEEGDLVRVKPQQHRSWWPFRKAKAKLY